MRAYNLHFNGKDLPENAVEIGWIGTKGPGIETKHWPRGELTGLPMLHGFTIELPEAYQTQGPQYPAIAFFQGEGQFAEAFERDEADPFVKGLNASEDHPMLNRRVDIIGGQFAFIWLTREEFEAGPTAPPRDTRRKGEHGNDDEGPNAWDTEVEFGRVWRSDRIDPNAGVPPTDPATGDYREPFHFENGSGDWRPWAKGLEPMAGHLGGTSFPYQALPMGLTATYLEFWEFGGLNFGGGSAQLDLKSEVFDWACG